MTASKTPRILIARMSAIGDTILTLPVACALRAHWPDAFIAWVVEEKSAAIVQDHVCLDETLRLPRGWFTKPAGLLAVRRMLRERRFDVTIDCQGLTKSALACWLSRARRRIGFRGRHGRELSPWLNNELVLPSRPHVVDRSLDLLTPLGIREPAVRWFLPINAGSRQRAREAADKLGLAARYAVVNPGASCASRRWEMDRFAHVARHLGARHGLSTLVIWGGADEQAAARQIVAESAGFGVLAPYTTLLELAALIEGGRLLVTADTGPMHMAVAVGTPCIGLHGTTRPADSGPYGAPHVALQVEHQGGSHRAHRRADNRTMRLITVEMVCQQCDALLGGAVTRTS